MKNILVIIFTLGIFSCNSKKEEKTAEDIITTDSLDNGVSEEGAVISNPATNLYVWRATPEYEKEKNPRLPQAPLPVDSLIKGLNQYYPNVYLEKVKQGGDTLYTKIANSQYLSEQMGSTGAEVYIADLVLNLTTVPGIKYIHLDMEEGSHAQPGTWTADNFKTYKEKKP